MGGIKDMFGLGKAVDQYISPSLQKKLRKMGYRTGRQLLGVKLGFPVEADMPDFTLDEVLELLRGVNGLKPDMPPEVAAELDNIITRFFGGRGE